MKLSCAIWVKRCPTCGLLFIFRANRKNQIYCSYKCWHTVRASQIRGVNNPCYGRKHTEEERREMSERHYDCSGSKNPLYGIGHTEATKRKLSIFHIGKVMSEETKQKVSIGLKKHWATHKHPSIGLSPSPETRKKLSDALKGSKCHLWKGGTSKEPYPFEFDHELKESIRARDKYRCQLCHKPQNGRRLPIHHIDYNKKNLAPSNLISLCESCHSKTNTHRTYYTKCFSELLQRGATNGHLFL